jgi:hypothetical protein
VGFFSVPSILIAPKFQKNPTPKKNKKKTKKNRELEKVEFLRSK